MKTACLSNSEIESRLVESGVSATAQRIAICKFVLCDADHPTADDVKNWVDDNFPKMSMATVYNTLGILVKAGLLKELKLPHQESVIYDNNIEKHHHFIDDNTGNIMDINEAEIQLNHSLQNQIDISGIEVIIRGKKKK